MKRAILSLLALSVVCAGMAQGFTIVRPANDAKVRETVRLLFPMNSVGETGYVGIYVGGKFLEAVTPSKGQQYLYYDLNTKARGIPDGPLTIEAVLFQDFADRPRIVDRSSIQVTVANSSSIAVPEGGFKLRYKFKPGTSWVYKLSSRVAVNNLSEANAGTMSTENLLAGADVYTYRLQYSVDNAYSNGDGLVRIQALTDPGKDSVQLKTDDNPDELQTFYDYQMHPLYMRISNLGREVFGSAPTYFPLEGTPGEAQRTDLYAVSPLPILPQQPVQPGGEGWNTGIQVGILDLAKKNETTSLVFTVPQVRAEVVGVEWEMNHPCVHLHYLRGEKMPAGLNSSSRLVNAQRVEEDIFFALDLGAILKMVRTSTVETKITVPVGGGTAGGPGPGGPPGASGVSGAGGPPRGGGSAGAGTGIIRPPTFGGLGGQLPFNQGRRGGVGGPAGVAGQGPAGVSGQGQGQGTGQGQGRTRTGGNTARVVRVTMQQVFTLEK